MESKSPDWPSVDDLLTEISECGWSVVNLFQTADYHWRANLHRRDTDRTYQATGFGVGETAAEALALAIDKIETAEEFIDAEITSTITPDFDINTLFADLKPTRPVVKRRI